MHDKEKHIGYRCSGPPNSILTPEFMKTNTGYDNYFDFLKAIGCNPVSDIDIEKLTNGDFDSAIQESTSFSSWDELCFAAGISVMEE